MDSSSRRRILFVDGDTSVCKIIGETLADNGHTIVRVYDGEAVFAALQHVSYDIILLAVGASGTHRIELVRRIAQNIPEIPVLAVSETGLTEDVVAAFRCGAWDVMVTPREELEDAIQHAIARAERMRERYLDHQLLETQIRDSKQQLETARKQLEDQDSLQETVFECLVTPLFLKDANKLYAACNNAFCAMIGLPKNKILGKSVFEIFPYEQAVFLDAMDNTVLSGKTSDFQETDMVHPDGSTRHYTMMKNPLHRRNGSIGGLVGVFYDITVQKQSEYDLRASLLEKDVLLKEIHHRVKNNLQLVSSLLALQTESAEGSAKPLLLSCYNRIRSMALLHEELYGFDVLDRIDFSSYLKTLSLKLFGTYLDGRDIDCDLDTNSVYLEINKAIPCGLLVTELVTNALRHGFSGRTSGRVTIGLHKKDEHIHLHISDNGIGLPESISLEHANSLGFMLVTGLISQLRATLTMQREHGTSYDIVFTPRK